ncbi:hypothetical protein E1301_Tti021999 [Triplophysa tibetana]|uniref:Arrestin-like N-terminal domain-containing protein n=1 Tax=Triplophysa tibetana TaxID=1572043 RepID=A0A5A9P3X6_9TELE|nr:hypothetical protein E1301_Tti021999 [Triplophysa tibetana]
MSLTVKSISVIYSPINQDNTFTNGDLISGQVIIDVAKETQMQSLSIKIKGKADVQWSEHYGKTTVVYSNKEKFYSMERFFVREDKSHGNDHELLKAPSGQTCKLIRWLHKIIVKYWCLEKLMKQTGLLPYNLPVVDTSVVAPGSHVYPFVFQLPQQNYPPSFKGSMGKIVYTLMTKLCRSLRVSSKAVAEFHYVPKPDLQNPELLVCLDVPYASDPDIKFPVVLLPPQTTSGAKCPSNSDFGIWNQPAGGNLYPNTPPMAPGQFDTPGNYGPSPGQFGASGNTGPSGQYTAPGYVGPLSQFAPPGYPGPPAQLHPPVSNFQQSDPSALPPYQDYQLYPHIPDETKKS